MLHLDMVDLLKAHGAEIRPKGDCDDWRATLNEHILEWRQRDDQAIWLVQYLPPGKYGCTMPLGWESHQITTQERVRGFIEDARAKSWLTKTVYLEFGPDATHPDLEPSLRVCPRGWRDKLERLYGQQALTYVYYLQEGKFTPEAVVKALKKQGFLKETAD
jgi:hypothetical protein